MNDEIPEFLRRRKDDVNTDPLPPPIIEKPVVKVLAVHINIEPEGPTVIEKIQRAMRENASELIGEINGYHDDFILHGKTFDAYHFFSSREVKPAIVKLIMEKLQPSLDELKASKTDPELNAAYAIIDVNANIKFLSGIMEAADRWVGNKPKKARVYKVVPAKKVKALKFLKEFPELNLVSIAPVKIIGAYELYVYNTKNRKLTRFVARTRDGLMVKGGSIIEYDKDNSEVKMVRKPAEFLPKVLEKKKKIMDGLTTKGSVPPTGRITADMILMRVE